MPDPSERRTEGSRDDTGWSSIYDDCARYGFSNAQRSIVERVPKGTTVLELGPSSGYMTKALVESGCVVDAIEINAADAVKARPLCRRMVVGSVEDRSSYDDLPGPYDVVLMADVLEHLRAPEAALAEVRKRISPNGQGFACIPNVAYYRMRLDLMKGRFVYKEYGLLDRTHLRFYTKETATELLKSCGFSVSEIIVPGPTVPRFGKLKEWVKTSWPELFAIQIIYRVRPS